jgi:hypothetical protein
MAPIFTGLAFMHGHIVDRELILRLGRGDDDRGAGARSTDAPAALRPESSPRTAPLDPACAACC